MSSNSGNSVVSTIIAILRVGPWSGAQAAEWSCGSGVPDCCAAGKLSGFTVPTQGSTGGIPARLNSAKSAKIITGSTSATFAAPRTLRSFATSRFISSGSLYVAFASNFHERLLRSAAHQCLTFRHGVNGCQHALTHVGFVSAHRELCPAKF